MRESSIPRTTVDEIYEEQLGHGAIIDDSTPLSEVVDALHYKEALEALYVVDPRERYVGVITRRDLVGWVEHTLEAPQSRDAFPWDGLAKRARQARAEDAVNPRSREIPVEPGEPLERALRQMLSASLTVVPVVAADGSIQGELLLTRALQHVLEDR